MVFKMQHREEMRDCIGTIMDVLHLKSIRTVKLQGIVKTLKDKNEDAECWGGG